MKDKRGQQNNPASQAGSAPKYLQKSSMSSFLRPKGGAGGAAQAVNQDVFEASEPHVAETPEVVVKEAPAAHHRGSDAPARAPAKPTSDSTPGAKPRSGRAAISSIRVEQTDGPWVVSERSMQRIVEEPATGSKIGMDVIFLAIAVLILIAVSLRWYQDYSAQSTEVVTRWPSVAATPTTDQEAARALDTPSTTLLSAPTSQQLSPPNEPAEVATTIAPPTIPSPAALPPAKELATDTLEATGTARAETTRPQVDPAVISAQRVEKQAVESSSSQAEASIAATPATTPSSTTANTAYGLRTTAQTLSLAQTLLDQELIIWPERNAVNLIQQVLNVDPQNTQAQRLLDEAASRLTADALKAYDDGLIDEAHKVVEEVLHFHPNYQPALELRSFIL